MTNFKFSLIFAILFSGVFGLKAQENQLTNELIWSSREFYAQNLWGIKPMSDGMHYTISGQGANTIEKYLFSTGEKVETLVNGSTLKIDGQNFRILDYTFSNDEQKLLFATKTEQIYRHSSQGTYYVLDLKTNEITLIDSEVRLPAFSPDGSKIAYVKDNNLYIFNIAEGLTLQITSDGERNNIINGATDWVYEEEFGFERAFYWSKEGNYLAWLRFDESEVPEFSFPIYGTLYPENYTFKYPKAGEKNAEVTAHFYDLGSAKSHKIDLGNLNDMYLPGLRFTEVDNILCLLRLNRHQNHLEYLLFDTKKQGKPSVFLEDKSSTYVLVDHNFSFTKNNNLFLFASEKSGFNHVYSYNFKNKKISPVTQGNFDVKEIYGTDGNRLFYKASKGGAIHTQIYSIGLNGKKEQRISPEKGNASGIFSSNFKFWFLTHSRANTAPVVKVMDGSGKEIKTLFDNQKVNDALNKYRVQPKEFFTITTNEGIELNAWMIKPENFNSANKYPVLMTLYNGPGHNLVKDEWGGTNYMWHQLLAQKGIIVVCVDGRGTGNRGKDFKAVTYQQLGKYETIDQIEAARIIGSYDYVDEKRIGIQGWSYGGYMTLLALTKGADYFACGISVAPVTSWRYYDTIYTERYMRTPQENPSGYDDNSPISHVDKLKNNTLLMVHGSADDNVHVQNAMEITTALVKANKQFEQFIYPDKNHGIYGGNTREHLFEMMTDFLEKRLKSN
jgi:dipeptidyl-peptidase-4